MTDYDKLDHELISLFEKALEKKREKYSALLEDLEESFAEFKEQLHRFTEESKESLNEEVMPQEYLAVQMKLNSIPNLYAKTDCLRRLGRFFNDEDSRRFCDLDERCKELRRDILESADFATTPHSGDLAKFFEDAIFKNMKL